MLRCAAIRQHALSVRSCLFFTLLMVGLVGCGGGGGGGGGGAVGQGTLVVLMAGGPGQAAAAVNVVIARVEANVGGRWTTVTSVPKQVDLADLTINEAALGSTLLPAGHYSQLRFVVSAATLTDAAGARSVIIPSSFSQGIAANTGFNIGSGQTTTILIYFNASKSVVQQKDGSLSLNPVVLTVVNEFAGTISGAVTDNGVPAQGAEVTATYTDGASYKPGTRVNTTATLPDGTFKLWALLPGTYAISAELTDPNADPTTTKPKTASAPDIVVVANQSAAAGTLALQPPPD